MMNRKLIIITLILHLQTLNSDKTENKTKYIGRFFEGFIKPMIQYKNDKLLKKKLRVTTRSFKFIVGLLKESKAFKYWKNHQLKSPNYISVEKQACIFLYFLSGNKFYSDLTDYFGVAGSGAVSQILNRVAKGLMEYKSVYINGHAGNSMRQMLLDANSRGFTHCIGLIDGVVNKITVLDNKKKYLRYGINGNM